MEKELQVEEEEEDEPVHVGKIRRYVRTSSQGRK
jgi:hypothetical protein